MRSRRRTPQKGTAGEGPRPLRNSLEMVVGRLSGSRPGALASVFERWEEIAGASLARHAEPVRLSRGTLVVRVDAPARASVLRSLGGELLTRVGEICGERPERLDIVVSGERGSRGGPSRPP